LGAPCAGPILGLILTGAALHGASTRTSLMLAAYAAGAATSLALALLVGGRVFALMKRSLGVGEWVRRGLGIAVLAAVLVIASGLDTSVLTQVSLATTTALEQGLLDRFRAGAGAPPHPTEVAAGNQAMKTGNPTMTMKAADDLPIEDGLPSLSGAVKWLNSPPLTDAALKGKVVLIDFWTYSCINCLRELPYVRAWTEKYKDHGLVVIGVHAPEFAFERNVDNVKQAVAQLKLDFPIAIDNDYAIWRAFDNEYWPAEYFVDARGRIRYHQFGEGDYATSERIIQELLVAAAQTDVPTGLVTVNASGAEAASDAKDDQSPETYIGYAQAEHFASPGGVAQGAAHVYTVGTPALNQWGLTGDWTVAGDRATLDEPGGGIVFRFHARDLHLEPAGQRTSEVAVLAGGCFWGVQGVFQHVAGVTSAVSGYAGGSEATAHYETVSTGTTGHAESVRIIFDPRRISYGRLLQIYFSVAHDPTDLNRQGPDVGTQYRSAIFPQNEEQARLAAAYIAQLGRAQVFAAPIVTRVEPGKAFYPAEAYQQNYLTENPDSLYIVINDLPKLAALKRGFPTLYRLDPVLVAMGDISR